MSIHIYAYVYTHIHVCQYARICPFVMHSHKFLYMEHCWSNKGHMGMKMLQSEICILLKCHADQWKLSHFKFSITSQIHRLFLWLLLDLKLPNVGRKLKQLLEIPILTRELYVFTRKDLCFGTGRKSFAKYFCLNSAFLRSILVAKIISPVIFDTSFIQTKNLTQIIHSWRKICLSKFLWCAVHVIFYFKEKFCVSHASTSHLRDVYLLKAIRAPCRKQFISGCFWLKLFIQNGKMLFL